MKKYLYLLSIILFLSCNSKSTNEESMEKLSIEQFFKIDTLGTFEDEFLFAKEFLVYSDSILITLNKAHKDGYFIEFYNYINKRHISKLFKYGNGPNEMLSARIHLNNNKLFVNDYIKAQVAVIDMDSIIYSNNYNIKIRGHKVLGLPSAVICNNKFILENPYYFECEKLGIKQGDSRFIVTDGEKPYEYDRIYSYNTRNVNVDGCIITNDEKKRIMYAPMHNSNI